MKVIILKEQFVKSTSLVGQAVSIRPNLPVLGNFLLKTSPGALEITATNLETTISEKIPVKTDEAGETTVPARLLIDLCQVAVGEKISLETEKDNLIVKVGAACANLSTIAPSEFPTPAPFVEEGGLVLERKVWQELVSAVAFCASPEGGRPVLSGILLQATGSTLNLVATDGYRLAKKEVKLKGSLLAIIPARTLSDANKALEAQEDETVEIGVNKDKNQLRLQTKDLTITTRLLEGDYPNYEQIIPTSFVTELRCSTKELADAIKLASLFAREVGNVVRLETEDKTIKVSAITAQVGEAETRLPASFTDEKIKIAFNSRFLLEALAAFKSKEIVFSFSGATSAALLRGTEDPSLVYLVMPVRIQS
jgi:DNA polymerase-3 subunit beta